ncbi:MAG: TlyA family RNA methyltransferase [Emcibacteraceae bacterium]|jgi:23S rRNA (cytidine1920-2'-O)/16S rRNA (cytidine1409-2'-O)-methyltransferase|uniref:TlyA family RNA methyltransferase n=1 Tax=Pseudemcibacter sp. TaxID=2943293 RepID=UPI003F6A24A6|nr:TlyA family RNA methyltransferase [Kordiimonadaceae bacterium]MDG1020702.1 TlyA family RNA methyltransferase [Emcibacteraceae bacterium]MDG1727503.1 TlyA family RNA methyltransferase [Emcibacteraceae bacterium]
MAKKRVDQLLVERGLAESRSRAQAYIMAGNVYTGEQKIAKPGQQVKEDINLEVRGKEHPWVSRGGLKLVQGIDEFKIDVTDMTVIDVGASTGGFTDVCLEKGAKKVYAVDVGHGQLAWKIRNDERVVVLEKTNARYLTDAEIPEKVNLIVCDASFIGLQTVLPSPMKRAQEDCVLIALIKPQFEVGKGKVGKGGVVREPELHKEVCDKIENWLRDEMDGWNVIGITQSPIKGPEGNIEFLIGARYEP